MTLKRGSEKWGGGFQEEALERAKARKPPEKLREGGVPGAQKEWKEVTQVTLHRR